VQVEVYREHTQMARAAATEAAAALRGAIATRGQAVVVFAAASSQIQFLDFLLNEPDVDWDKMVLFQLDEYVGVDASHPASFRRFLDERVISRVRPGTCHLIRGEEADSQEECNRLNELIGGYDVDLALVGIGENGHLAFNDPPADFEEEAAYAIVDLDEACRRQQANEGWFDSIADVPRVAISMSIKQIMRSRVIVCSVPDARKSQAVRECLTGSVSPMRPASILQQHTDVHIYLDSESANGLFVSDRKGDWGAE
jgi:glucosamine-6-phosphate deaminase